MYRVSVLQDEDVLEMDGGDVCTTTGMCFMPQNYMLKNGKFMLCLFYHNFYKGVQWWNQSEGKIKVIK